MKSLYDALYPEKSSETQENLPIEPAELTAKGFSRAIVESDDYRDSIIRRIANDTLPSAVECRILDHALGKPVEHLEVRDETPLENLTYEVVEARLRRAQRMLQLVQATRTNDEVHTALPERDEGPPTPSSVH